MRERESIFSDMKVLYVGLLAEAHIFL